MKEIKVSSCDSCPFANNDDVFGRNYCNLGRFSTEPLKQLPEFTIHDNCPLKKESVHIKLK